MKRSIVGNFDNRLSTLTDKTPVQLSRRFGGSPRQVIGAVEDLDTLAQSYLQRISRGRFLRNLWTFRRNTDSLSLGKPSP